ncbi:outer membrane beta-barrel protein [Aquicoccus sp. SCR17]|nr:outer membrane beta-barrel protein [Carideicomes alvinocaridis]
MKLMSAALVAIALPAPLLAGNMAPAPADPVVSAPAPAPVEPLSYGGDWTGAYAGVQAGQLNGELSGGGDGDGTVYGVHGGYDYDFGRFVLGGELDYDTGDIDVGPESIDSITRLKVKGGYDLGRTMIYATLGAARADTSLGDADGGVAGLGMAYKVTDSFTLGGEYLAHRFEDVNGSGTDLDADTFGVRASFRF